jgi:hypothetical protein
LRLFGFENLDPLLQVAVLLLQLLDLLDELRDGFLNAFLIAGAGAGILRPTGAGNQEQGKYGAVDTSSDSSSWHRSSP